jgi:hypothetical protein
MTNYKIPYSGIGLCVKIVMERNKRPVERRYALKTRNGTVLRSEPINAEKAAERNQAFRDRGSEYRWVLVEGGE